jgi:hypothetical protein
MTPLSESEWGGGHARGLERSQLRLYADAIAMWGRGFDTQSIATQLAIAEHQAARWVANFRDVVRAGA